ncbi:MAG: hypothetical protein MJA30_04195 [Cytophagales bacterium]|nr:hypothetical protein [Cytophagales bacterium]
MTIKCLAKEEVVEGREDYSKLCVFSVSLTVKSWYSILCEYEVFAGYLITPVHMGDTGRIFH